MKAAEESQQNQNNVIGKRIEEYEGKEETE